MASRGHLYVSLLPVLLPLFRILARASFHGYRLYDEPVYGVALGEIEQHACEVTSALSDQIVISLIQSGWARVDELSEQEHRQIVTTKDIYVARVTVEAALINEMYSRVDTFLEALRVVSEAGGSDIDRFIDSAFARAAIIAPLRAEPKKRPVRPRPLAASPPGIDAVGDA